MAIPPSLVLPKGIVKKLANLPRDVFESREGIIARTIINLREDLNAIGADVSLKNRHATASVTITFDTMKSITLQSGGDTFDLDNVLFGKVDIAGGALVDCYIAGWSINLLEELLK